MNNIPDNKFPSVLYGFPNIFVPLRKIDKYLGSPNYCLYTNDTGTIIKRIYIKELGTNYFSNQIELIKQNIQESEQLIERRKIYLKELEDKKDNENK